MTWELIKVSKTDWIPDDSGIYILINWYHVNGSSLGIRLDIFTTGDHEPVISFLGKADDVRKAVMRWFTIGYVMADIKISLEHAAYIGAELAKAEILGIDYIQD
ncbi:hypothetical protein LCGC14_1117390 [marine sediment metagenome]|uniref:DUF4346 domain-containing protein n=1 Tax=marine sediment metagenome TaxID=412755 RepID=A0A0F9MST4_9ZZZZ